MGHPFINAPAAMRLFGVTHFETIWDDTTDTHCVLGWSDTQVVVAFRWGTAWWWWVGGWGGVGVGWGGGGHCMGGYCRRRHLS
jgi:hypothetical protein